MIAVTGANGYVGKRICQAAEQSDVPIIKITRETAGDLAVDSLDPAHLAGCTAVIHTAARAHRMGEFGESALAAYRATNVVGTAKLIAAMRSAKVPRLIYVSSIKALGERTMQRPLGPDEQRMPEDPYGISKAEAEETVLAAHAAGFIAAVIIRPVLVYGEGAKGNLERLLSAIAHGRLLPVGGIRNRRSMIGVGNLAEALLASATASAVRFGHQGQHGMNDITKQNSIQVDQQKTPTSVPRSPIYHVADDGVVSTRRLVEVLADGMGVKPRLINLPRWLAVGGATLLGKGAMARRLFDDLEVDASAFTKDTGWQPKKSLEDGLREMAAAYAQQHRVGRFA